MVGVMTLVHHVEDFVDESVESDKRAQAGDTGGGPSRRVATWLREFLGINHGKGDRNRRGSVERDAEDVEDPVEFVVGSEPDLNRPRAPPLYRSATRVPSRSRSRPSRSETYGSQGPLRVSWRRGFRTRSQTGDQFLGLPDGPVLRLHPARDGELLDGIPAGPG